MTIQQMKDAIRHVYNTESWRRKVDNMYDDQVVAIYYNFLKRGVLGKVLRNERPASMRRTKPKQKYEQLSMFDLIDLEKGDEL